MLRFIPSMNPKTAHRESLRMYRLSGQQAIEIAAVKAPLHLRVLLHTDVI
jgi:hypothetical protein